MKTAELIRNFQAEASEVTPQGLQSIYEEKAEAVFSPELARKELSVGCFVSRRRLFLNRIQEESRKFELAKESLAEWRKSKEEANRSHRTVAQKIIKTILFLVVTAVTLPFQCKMIYQAISGYVYATSSDAISDWSWLKDLGIAYGIFLVQCILFSIIQKTIGRKTNGGIADEVGLMGEIVLDAGICIYLSIVCYDEFILQEIFEGIIFAGIISIPMVLIFLLYDAVNE